MNNTQLNKLIVAIQDLTEVIKVVGDYKNKKAELDLQEKEEELTRKLRGDR